MDYSMDYRMDIDFFKQKEVKKIRKTAGGDTYVIIYIKLLLNYANDSKVVYLTEDEFKNAFKNIEENEEDVKITIFLLTELRLIKIEREE